MPSLNAFLIKLLSLAFNQQTISKEICKEKKGRCGAILACVNHEHSSEERQANETGTHLGRDFTILCAKGSPYWQPKAESLHRHLKTKHQLERTQRSPHRCPARSGAFLPFVPSGRIPHVPVLFCSMPHIDYFGPIFF